MMRRLLTASEGNLAHGCHDLRHQPDGTAREITMDLVSICIIITHHMEDWLGWFQQVGSWQSN